MLPARSAWTARYGGASPARRPQLLVGGLGDRLHSVEAGPLLSVSGALPALGSLPDRFRIGQVQAPLVHRDRQLDRVVLEVPLFLPKEGSTLTAEHSVQFPRQPGELLEIDTTSPRGDIKELEAVNVDLLVRSETAYGKAVRKWSIEIRTERSHFSNPLGRHVSPPQVVLLSFVSTARDSSRMIPI